MKKLNIKMIIRSIIVFVGFFLSSYLQYIPVILFKLDISKIRNNIGMQVLLSCFSSFVFMIILLIIYNKDLKREFKTYISNFAKNFDTGFKWYLVGLLIMMISNLFLYYVLSSGGAINENTVQKMIKSSPILMAIDACIIGPFNEEIIFRKSLYDIFKKNKYIFIILSFLLFGGAHVFSTAKTLTDYLYIIPYGALGGVFAISYSKTNTVFTSMIMHILHNSVLLILSCLIYF